MGFKTWLYHDDHEAQIFDSDAVPELKKQGWRDSPAKLPATTVETIAKDKPKVK